MTKLCRDCPGRHSRMCCHTLAKPLLDRARHEVQQARPANQDARMIRWLTGTGEFDTNDPCDEWPVP